MLAPSEFQMAQNIKDRKIPISPLEANPAKLATIRQQLQELLLKEAELKLLGQKVLQPLFTNLFQAIRAYLRSVNIMSDKEIFNVDALPHGAFAASMGLLNVPHLKFNKNVSFVEISLPSTGKKSRQARLNVEI